SYAVPVTPKDHWDIRIAAVVLTAQEKDVSSRVGMKRTVDTSVFYKGWLESLPTDLEEIRQGIKMKDIEKVGAIAEANRLKMHATTIRSNPRYINCTMITMSAMQTVQTLRKEGIPAYFTTDAGPHVKVL